MVQALDEPLLNSTLCLEARNFISGRGRWLKLVFHENNILEEEKEDDSGGDGYGYYNGYSGDGGTG